MTHDPTNPAEDASNAVRAKVTACFEGKTAEKGRPRSKKEQIVQAAIKVFLENGYAGTSMNKVAEEADVIKATIYSHFKDKEELFAAIVEEVTFKRLDVDDVDFDDFLQQLEPKEFLDLLTTKFKMLSKSDEYKALLRVVIGESERFPELANIYVKTVILKGMTLAGGYFEKHKELDLNNVFATAHVCCGSMISWMIWQEILGGKNVRPLDLDDVVTALHEFIDAKLEVDQKKLEAKAES